MSRNPENQYQHGRNDDQVRSTNDQRSYKVSNSRRYSGEDIAREKENARRSSWSSGLSSIDYDLNAE